MFAPFLTVCCGEFNTLVIAYPVDRAMDYAALVEYVRPQLPTGSPFVIVAESFSGPVGVALAALHMPHMRGLIMCCSFAENPRPELVWCKPLLHLLPLRTMAHRMGAMGSWWCFGRFSSAELNQALRSAIRQLSAAVLEVRLKAVLEVNYSGLWTRLAVPVLYLQADEDRIVPARVGKTLGQLMPGLSMRVVAGPHLLLQANPRVAFEAIKQFLQELHP